jgi:hypothetical protein
MVRVTNRRRRLVLVNSFPSSRPVPRKFNNRTLSSGDKQIVNLRLGDTEAVVLRSRSELPEVLKSTDRADIIGRRPLALTFC